MERVDTATAVAQLPAQNAAGTPGYFTQGDPGSGLAATVPGQDWFNIIQEELMTVVLAAGLTPSKADTDQLLEGIQILSGLYAGGISRGCHDFAGLIIKNNAANPTYQVDIDADGGVLFDADGKKLTVTGVNLTVDITASGANGLDTGTEANAWYYLWVISNGTTVAGLISASAASPTLPSGYTYKSLVGAILNSSGDFIRIDQAGSEVHRDAIIVLNAGTSEATNPCASVGSFASALPPTAVGPLGTVYNANANGNISFGMSNDCLLGRVAVGTIERVSMAGMHFAAGGQAMYYVISPTGGSAFVEVSGWRY